MLEAKNYKVKIIGSFTGESAEKKTPYIGLELETQCGNYIDWISYMTDKTADRALKTLAGAGFIGKKISDLSNEKMSMDDLFEHNPSLTAVVEHEEYTNAEGEIKQKAVVKWLNTGDFGPAKADHAKSVQIFGGTSFDGKLKELQSKMKPKAKKASKESGEEDDQDLPF
ncbi:MAG: hypothetical protein V2I33_07370 [Kangiellaceae bacterium]|jgi:hypothetical protein|nr:hypothetical protein [Kangiellaceae bacterium]